MENDGGVAAFRKLVMSLRVGELRRRFPLEEGCHRAMLERARKGRAIVSPELHRFKDFLLHIGQPRPDGEWTIDRIDPFDPEYAPGKIRWADKRQQANNRTNVKKVRGPDGVVRTLSDLSRMHGMPRHTIYRRLKRGWTEHEAIYGKGKPVPLTNQDQAGFSSDELSGLWPKGATYTLWETGYRSWVSVFKGKGASRYVFFAWVGKNQLDLIHMKMEKAFPDYMSGGDLTKAIKESELYKREETLSKILKELEGRIDSSPSEMSLLLSLRRGYANVRRPQDAAAAFSQPTD